MLTDHQYGLRYTGDIRFFSYAHQLAAVVRSKPATVVEVGGGPGIVANALRRLGIVVITIDIDDDTEADVVGSVLSLPLKDEIADTVLCCQVLEHVPFERFEQGLREIRRIARRTAIVSLPDHNRYMELTIRLPRIGRRTVTWSPPRLRAPTMPDHRLAISGHFWEIGYSGYSTRTVQRGFTNAGWRVRHTWRVPELPWHRFFLLDK